MCMLRFLCDTLLIGFRGGFLRRTVHIVYVTFSITGFVNTELGRANEALTNFANGVDDIVHSPNQSRRHSLSNECVSDIYHFSALLSVVVMLYTASMKCW